MFDKNLQECIERRPTLRAWLAEYDAISAEYRKGFEAQGIVFEPYNEHMYATEQVLERLRNKGALFRNGRASISINWLSSACRACSEQAGSKTFYLSLKCNKNCYFCFNPNQIGYGSHLKDTEEWKAEVDAFKQEADTVTHIGLTGGEPLLHPQETLEFLRYVQNGCPGVHTRMYTAGDPLDIPLMEKLAAAGLSEIRFSIKLDDGKKAVESTLAKIALAREYFVDVLVEMPVIPGTEAMMQNLLCHLDKIGIRGINLLEFCFPLNRWQEFEKRGFRVKNPPFAILYNYGYAGGLPVAASELGCLELVEFALDEGLSLGVHYCSLDNKNRYQIFQQNTTAYLNPLLYEQSDSDFFYRVAKVFDEDVGVVKEILEAHGVTDFSFEEQGLCLAFHPQYLTLLKGHEVIASLSCNVVEGEGRERCVRELALNIIDRDREVFYE